MGTRFAAGLAAVAVLAMPAAAAAGGWAIVRLSSTPDGLRAGSTWVVDLEVLQHGRTPLRGVQPAVVVTERRTGESRTVPARATGRAGVYRARVQFPTAGTWRYEVDDGFGRRHTYPTVRIGDVSSVAGEQRAAQGAPGDRGTPWAALLAAALAGLAAAAASVALQRRASGATAGAEGR